MASFCLLDAGTVRLNNLEMNHNLKISNTTFAERLFWWYPATDFRRECARTSFNYKVLEQFITWYRESVLLVAIEDPHALITRDHHHDSRTNSQVQGEMICTSQAMT